MSPYRQALDVVHTALHGLHAQGVELCAAREALARLRSTEDTESTEKIPAAHAPRFQMPAPIPVPAPKAEPISVPSVDIPTTGTKAERLAALRTPVLACTLCPHLAKSRTQVVFGVGSPEAEIMFVGEPPDEEEDRQGEPFVGEAGQLLTKIIVAMGFAREEVYIANVLKCRPDMPPGIPGKRKPKPAEMQTCLPYLRAQIEIIQPRVVVALGATAMEGLLGETSPMARLRGRWHEFAGIPLMATYHPSYLLHKPSLGEKRKVWEDMLLVLERLEKPISDKQRGFFLPR